MSLGTYYVPNNNKIDFSPLSAVALSAGEWDDTQMMLLQLLAHLFLSGKSIVFSAQQSHSGCQNCKVETIV